MKGDIVLREFRAGDAQQMEAIANSERISRNLRDAFPHPYTLEHAENFIARLSANDPQTVFAIEENGVYVGNIGLHPKDDIYRRTAELGYFIGEQYWGRGIATKAISQIVKYGFNELDLLRIEAGVFHHNPASMRVLEKNGFVKEGIARSVAVKHGEIIDEHRYAIIRGRFDHVNSGIKNW